MPAAAGRDVASRTAFGILVAISMSHLLNDLMQSVISAIYPILKKEFLLDFSQIGIIQLVFQCTASILQPIVGIYTDKKPMPFSLPVGMGCTLLGLLLLATAGHYSVILISVALIGLGSSIFHPESSRVARMASGGRHGLAQSLFQVGGNFGSAIGPLLAAFIVLPRGQGAVAWFALAALAGIIILSRVGFWYRAQHRASLGRPKAAATHVMLPRAVITRSIIILALLIFSKFFYMAALSSYYTFFLIDKFQVSIRDSQLLLFVFLGAVAVGTIAGGPIGDRFGRKFVIWFSILGVLPFTLALPHANLAWTVALSVIIGLVLSSAFSAIIVYAQELIPGKVGLVSGLFFGFAFGMGGIGAAALGELADRTSITFVFQICAFLPLIGLLTAFLPNVEPKRS
ncbi:MFS transporter, FSR family, fosmidomycin resistance protein [Kaistia soli DSM 19436]|uniref:MFS transporter, FSR family, fosmidomycin resistance protein n=1 Tax=Kaistia soli DSM 19436 TaxID=1122133 RepID=A0A1M4UG90_9HYPH|nr:MFS transporter [Kaistia soli]SHE55648.1 MFS transporter, FSR family, fosmidomycin resistance protein [Kaistia soli DSM 19436]